MSQPFKCPICHGNGYVAAGFYDQTSGHWSGTTIAHEPCRTCNGSGIVWGFTNPKFPFEQMGKVNG